MSRASLVVMFSVVLAAVGCGGVQEEQHQFSREQVHEAAISNQNASFDFTSDGAHTSFERSAIRPEGSPQAMLAAPAESCSGWCNANYCECTGSFECCLAGCVACWEVAQ